MRRLLVWGALFATGAQGACDFPAVVRALARANKPKVTTTLWETKGKERWVWAVEAKALWLVGEPADAAACKSPSLLVRRRLDLNKDVVATDADVGSSSYLVTKAWAGDLLLQLARGR